MPYTDFSFPLTKGMDRSTVPCKADLASFYTLKNVRQSRSMLGQLEQTPRFYLYATVTQSSYWNGSTTVTETTTNGIYFYQTCGMLGTISITARCPRGPLGVIPTYEMTTYPTTDGVTKGCLFTISDFGGSSITLGNRLDVEIDGTNTFKWRINNGAYTTGVVIDMAGNVIDSGAITLYWLASTGFTVTDQFCWTRTDTVGLTGTVNHKQIDNQLFFSSGTSSSTVYVIELGASLLYCRTVGYRPVQAANLTFDQGHLFLVAGPTVLCSDVSDYDVFTATDVNEADSFTPVNATTRALAVLSTTGVFIYAVEVLQNRVFLFSTYGIFYADYSGLPAPYTFRFMMPLRLVGLSGNVTTLGDGGIYFYTDRELCLFNGASISILCDFSKLGMTYPIRIVYNPIYREILVLFGNPASSLAGTVLTYDETKHCVHLRAADFSTSGATSMNVDTDGKVHLGSLSRKIFAEDTSWIQSPAFDATDGAAFETPTICTQVFGTNISLMKETSSLNLAATVTTTASSVYSVNTFTRILLKWYNSIDGLISGSPSTDSNAFWVNSMVDGMIDYPRVAYRFLAYQLELTGTDGSKPPGATTIQTVETQLYQPKSTDR